MNTPSPLSIACLDVPVADARLLPLLWHKGSPWVEDIKSRMEGRNPGSLDRFLVAQAGKEFVAHVWYTVARSDPRLGLLGHVFTRPEYRRQGVSSRLMEAALDQFTRDGGEVMQLFTYNPETLRFYERFGFQVIHGSRAPHAGDWSMRGPAGAEARVEEWFSRGECQLRPLAEEDLPRYCLLYNVDYATVLKDRAQSIGLGLEAELAFLLAMEKLRQGRGKFLVLDNGAAIVGIASLVQCDFAHQSHVGLVDYYLHPRFAPHAAELIDAVLAQRGALGLEFVHALAVDDEKRRTFASLGFRHRGRLAGHYRVEDRRLDCDWFEA